jgi:hypothetical protein
MKAELLQVMRNELLIEMDNRLNVRLSQMRPAPSPALTLLQQHQPPAPQHQQQYQPPQAALQSNTHSTPHSTQQYATYAAAAQPTIQTAAAHSNNRAGQPQNHTIAPQQQYYQQSGPPQSNPHPQLAAPQTQQMQPGRIQQQQATPMGQPTVNPTQATLSNNHQNLMSKMSLTPAAHPLTHQ